MLLYQKKHLEKKSIETINFSIILKERRACESASTLYKWAVAYDTLIEECIVMLSEPECRQTEWSRSNYLGDGGDGKPISYQWRLPHFPSKQLQTCVLRMRYNISTNDFDQFNTDYTFNKQK